MVVDSGIVVVVRVMKVMVSMIMVLNVLIATHMMVLAVCLLLSPVTILMCC